MRIIVLGDRNPEYLTHREIDAAMALMPDGVERAWVPTDSPRARALDSADAVWLVPGGPYADDDAALGAVEHCLRAGTPFLGTCSGFQYACLHLCRSVAGFSGAAHAEAEPDAVELVIVPLRCSLYGERRTVTPVAGTRLAELCGADAFEGFHFCGYGLAERFVPVLERAGVTISASAPDAGVEGIELPDHPFFLGTAFQPQVGASEADHLHPLLAAFLDAAAAGERTAVP